MQRKAYQTIEQADGEGIRTFVIYGLASVGKTTLVLNYVKAAYDKYLYVDAQFDQGFSSEVSICENKNALTFFSDYFHLEPEYLVNIPIIIDEPSEKVLDSRLFTDYGQELKLFIIVSDVSRKEKMEKAIKTSPNMKTIQLFPLNFGEFLIAQDKEWYDEVVVGHTMSKRKLPDMIHEELLDLFDVFRMTGGMPEVVEEYVKSGNYENIRQKQIRTASAVIYPVLKRNMAANKVESVLDAVGDSVDKEGHKFMYASIRDGATKKEYDPTIDYLCSHDMLFKIPRLNDDRDFRLYLSDIGLYMGNRTERLESLLLREMRSSGMRISYWESGKGASVGMIVEGTSGTIPIELKEEKSNARSVKAFLKEFNLSSYIRFCGDNIKVEPDYVSLPYYAAYTLAKIM